MINWKLQKNADAPVPKRGRRLQWTIPLVDIKPGDMMVLDMSPVEAHKKVNAVRSFVSREQKKMGLKFSVYITDAGIAIFRRSEDEHPPEHKDNKWYVGDVEVDDGGEDG